MNIEILPDPDAVASAGAAQIARAARDDCADRGCFVLAVSGGRTPWQMLKALANEELPWHQIQIVQVDERVAPAGDAVRNLTHLRESLLERVPIEESQIHAMPVEMLDLGAAASGYSKTLHQLSGSPPVLDLVHLGLGPDGHTASLVPGDAVLDVANTDVAMTAGLYQGHRRMTLTYPILNRARRILWLVTGSDKVTALKQLRNRDTTIPAGRVNQENATVLADRAAAAEL